MLGEEEGPSFEFTPAWVIGAVVFVIVGVSLAIDKLLSNLGSLLKRHEKKPLYEALLKIKEELMLMGFVSLLLAFVQDKVQHWCVPKTYVDDWLPCKSTATPQVSFLSSQRRRLLAEDEPFTCKEGYVPFIGLGVLHDLHYLIFILAVVHVISCTITVLLGEVKIGQWWKWEDSLRYKMLNNDKNDRITDIRSFAFIRERFHGIHARKRNYVYSFFKHLAGKMTEADFEAMRLGFILTHCDGDQSFNFHNYMVYAYEADFQSVVTIRWFLWLYAVISLTLHVAGWNIYFWLSLVPLVISSVAASNLAENFKTITFLLIVGTKLEKVITDLATFLGQRNTYIIGDIRIQPSDDYFWFRRPRAVLVFIHIILFMNSFGFAIFFWTLFKFSFNSCLMGSTAFAIARLVILVAVQTICSYSTLPLYAIVTQMGTKCNEEAMIRAIAESAHGDVESPTASIDT